VDPAAELTRDEVVLRARGKALEAAHDDWTLNALGLLNYQQIVISRTLGKGSSGEGGTNGSDSGTTSANEATRRGLEERNKQFVGDLLFGHTSPGFGLLSGGNSKDAAGLGGSNGSSSAGGCLGGALGSTGGSNGGSGSGGSSVSVRDLYRVKHGLQILTNGLRLEVRHKETGARRNPLLIWFSLIGPQPFWCGLQIICVHFFGTRLCILFVNTHAIDVDLRRAGGGPSVRCVAGRRSSAAARKRPPAALARRRSSSFRQV